MSEVRVMRVPMDRFDNDEYIANRIAVACRLMEAARREIPKPNLHNDLHQPLTGSILFCLAFT